MANRFDSRKLALEIGLFVFLVISVLAINYRIADQFEQDATSINLAGRQRMLTQRITKTLLELRQLPPHADRRVLETELREAIQMFDRTLRSLEQGGWVEGGDGRAVRLQKIDAPDAAALVEQAAQIWRPMRKSVLPRIADDEPLPPEVLDLAGDRMLATNLPLLDLMNRLTSRLESSRADIFWWFEFFVFMTALGVFALIVRQLKRSASVAAEESQHFEGLATRDPLTGLFNRREFRAALEREFASAGRSGAGFALLLVDLDGFKAVNDTFGHAAGDKVLCAVAARLLEHARAIDTVARVGGDEFVLICPGMTSREDAAGLSERLIDALNRPIAVDGSEARIGASIGIVFCCDQIEGCDELIRMADRAMYAAKHAGRNRHVFAEDATAGGG